MTFFEGGGKGKKRESLDFRSVEVGISCPCTIYVSKLCGCLRFFLICQDWMGDVLTNDIADFDGIQMKIRGDGRTYAFNVQTQSIREDDVHQTFIHTRGGPLWEIVRVNNSQLLHCREI